MGVRSIQTACGAHYRKPITDKQVQDIWRTVNFMGMDIENISTPLLRTWRHKSRKSVYQEIGRGNLQISKETLAKLGVFHSERIALALDGVDVVIYQSLSDASFWVRLVSEFEDGRFKELPYNE